MSLFKKAEVTSAYLKMGIMGFAGSGKTYTATETAIGLVQAMREKKIAYAAKPIYFLDTETGSDWIKPRIEAGGIELFTAKTRAFRDLMAAVTEAQSNASLLLVDSISHFWTELCGAYMKKKNRTRLQFEDWAYLKQEWRLFTDQFVNSPLHVIICGRAGYEYDYFEDEAGKKQLEKTDIKMKAENEMGYEPSLLVLMERHTDLETLKAYRTATVLKDRAHAIDGKQFRNPTVDSFMPHIKFLNLGGQQLGVDTSRTSEDLIPSDKRDHGPVQRRIVVDEIQTLLMLHIPGVKAEEKKRKIELIRKHFNNAAWTEIEEVMPLFDLRAGFEGLHQELEGKPSRYSKKPDAPATPAEKPAATAAEEMKDSLPDHSAPPAAARAEPEHDGIPPELDRRPKKNGNGNGAFNSGKWLETVTDELNKCKSGSDVGAILRDFIDAHKEDQPDAWKQAKTLARARLTSLSDNILAGG